jgi:hypothetical protein
MPNQSIDLQLFVNAWRKYDKQVLEVANDLATVKTLFLP